MLRRLAAGGAYALAGRALAAGAGFAVTAHLTRSLDDATLAAFFLGWGLVGVAVGVAGCGLPQTTLQQVSRARHDSGRVGLRPLLGRIYALAGAAGCATGVAVALAAPAYGRTFGAPGLSGVAPLLGLAVALMVFPLLLAETFRGLGDLRAASLFGAPLTQALFLALLLWMRPTRLATVLEAAALALAIQVTAGSILLAVYGRRAPSGTGSIPRVRSLLTISGPILVNNLVSMTLPQSGIWVLGAIAGEREIAQMGVANRMNLLLLLPSSVVVAIAPPVIADLRARGDTPTLERALRTTANLGLACTLAGLAALAAAGPGLLGWLFGARFAEAWPLVLSLGLGAVAVAAAVPASILLLMDGYQRITMRISVVTLVVAIGLEYGLGTKFGATGVALGNGVAVALQYLLLARAARARCGIAPHAGPR